MTKNQAIKLKKQVGACADPKNTLFYYNHYIAGKMAIDYKWALEAFKLFGLD